MRIFGVAVFVVLFCNFSYSQDTTKVGTDTTLAVSTVLQTLTKQYEQLLTQKKEIDDQILRVEGQIVLLRAMTSDSVKVKKGQ